jgi:glycosyltransferase involved in cell wall biosynthesis
VFPSYEEAFGMTLLEAMACGCCCLVNKLDTSLEIIGDAGFSIDVNNKNAFVGKIESLLKDEILRKRYEILARQRAVSTFDSKIASREFEAIFEKARS